MQTVTGIKEKMNTVFSGHWTYDSAWYWIYAFVDDLESMEKDKGLFTAHDRARHFFYVEVLKSSNKLFVDIDSVLTKMTELFDGKEFNKNKVAEKEVLNYLKQLDLDEIAVNDLSKKVACLPADKIKIARELIKKLVEVYNSNKPELSLVSAILLHNNVESYYPADLDEWMELRDEINKNKKDNEKKQIASLRFLGQAIAANNGNVSLFSYKTITDKSFDRFGLKTAYKNLEFLGMLYSMFLFLDSMSVEQKNKLFSTRIWAGIDNDVPIKDLIVDKLAQEPFINDYLSSIGELAQSLGQSKEKILAGNDLTVGTFITVYERAGDQEDYKPEVQLNYVEEFIKENKNLSKKKDGLVKLLRLYTQFRECTLADYRGLLSDVDQKLRFDWKGIVENELDEDKKRKVRRYINNLRRPFRLKIEIDSVLREIDWQQEPYLSRVIELSTIYEELYASSYGSLVYFNMEDGQWEFNWNEEMYK